MEMTGLPEIAPPAAGETLRIGILSDTHDLLRPEVEETLRGCACILHAGDVSSAGILARLREIAPVIAVRGNNERGETAQLPLTLDFTLAGLRFVLAHKRKDLPDLTGADVAVCGHTHQYAAQWLPPAGRERTLVLNPGSCGPRRFVQPITLAVMEVSADGFQVRRVEIPHRGREAAPRPGADMRAQIETVVRETQRGTPVAEIARRHGLDPALTEQIARLYVTHPGVTVEGIMGKMGL